MIAYFALLSFVPLLLLSLALLGLVHQADAGSFFVRQLEKTFPNTSLDSILRAVRAIQTNAAALGAVGGGFLLWSSLSFFSVLESAFNIVYGRPNRGLLHGKALATMMMVGSLVSLFVSLVIGSVGQEILKRYFGFAGNDDLGARRRDRGVDGRPLRLPDLCVLRAHERRPDPARGAARRRRPRRSSSRRRSSSCPCTSTSRSTTRCCRRSPGPAMLLVWLYVMANVIVLGAEVNWWRAGRGAATSAET